ncbi:MAG: N-acetyltransferase [Caulobacteraceae bacterium]|nr:N-acetyltransferase [Caulobacteraceae bacterium]
MTAILRAAPKISAETPPLSLRPERPEDAVAVEHLIDRAFGPGRFAKTAERLREGRKPLTDLSFVAWDNGVLVGCVRQWPVTVGDRPVVFLGPFAVDPAWRSRGLGAALIAKACAAATEAGHDAILLVGDAPYFGPLGFDPVPKGQVVLPGPVDARRILTHSLKPGAGEGLSGLVKAGW